MNCKINQHLLYHCCTEKRFFFQNGCSEVSESSSTSSELGNSISNLNSSLLTNCSTAGSNKAPGSQLTHKPVPFQRRSTVGLELTNKLLAIDKDPTLGEFNPMYLISYKKQFIVLADSLEREQRKQTLCFAYSSLGSSFFSTGNDTVESVVGKWIIKSIK